MVRSFLGFKKMLLPLSKKKKEKKKKREKKKKKKKVKRRKKEKKEKRKKEEKKKEKKENHVLNTATHTFKLRVIRNRIKPTKNRVFATIGVFRVVNEIPAIICVSGYITTIFMTPHS